MLYLLFGISFVLLIALVATAIYMVLQKKQQMENEEGQSATIHTSGMFSLVRQSPRKALNDRKMDKGDIEKILKDKDPQAFNHNLCVKYFDFWNEILEFNINTIEKGDKTGLQTYCYDIPEKDKSNCSYLSGNTYVTREQLQNYPNIIPPFYLGCGVKIIAKEAWNTNLNGTGWQPLLPVNGKYITPERSLVVKI